MEDIRGHPWFASIDWVSLDAKDMQPPFVPDVSIYVYYVYTARSKV